MLTQPAKQHPSALLEARALCVAFGSEIAVDSVDLSLAPGDLVGIVGPATAGKSSLFKALCLLLRPTGGCVFLGGQDLTRLGRQKLSQQQARFGFAFQNLGLFDRQSALANVAFALLRRGADAKEADVRARDALRSVGLAGSEHKLPHELSGGMQRRLALARAMVALPDVALFDDPFVGLDPVACARIAQLIVKAHRQNGGVTLVAAGDPTPLVEIADRLILMEEGRFVVDLPAREFHSGADPAVAAYLHGGRES